MQFNFFSPHTHNLLNNDSVIVLYFIKHISIVLLWLIFIIYCIYNLPWIKFYFAFKTTLYLYETKFTRVTEWQPVRITIIIYHSHRLAFLSQNYKMRNITSNHDVITTECQRNYKMKHKKRYHDVIKTDYKIYYKMRQLMYSELHVKEIIKWKKWYN